MSKNFVSWITTQTPDFYSRNADGSIMTGENE